MEHVHTLPKSKQPKKKLVASDAVLFDMNEWTLEVNRVTPLLKIHITNDNKDWRLHLSQLQKHLTVDLI